MTNALGVKPPSPTRSRGSRHAVRAGDRFQQAIALSAAHCPAVRLRELPKCGSMFVGKGETILQRMPCDFVGCFTPSGRALFFDAKRCEDKYGIDLANKKILKPHQAFFLAGMRGALVRPEAVSGLLVECIEYGEYLWLDAGHLFTPKFKKWTEPGWVSLGKTTHQVDFLALAKAYGEVEK